MNIINSDFKEKYFITTEHGVFTPRYTYESYNEGTDELVGVEIIATAEEVYEEFLQLKNTMRESTTPQESKIDKSIKELREENEALQERLAFIQESDADNILLINELQLSLEELEEKINTLENGGIN